MRRRITAIIFAAALSAGIAVPVIAAGTGATATSTPHVYFRGDSQPNVYFRG